MATTANIGAPAECNFERRRGDTKDIAIRLKADGVVIATAEGYTALLTINTVKDPNPPQTGVQVFQATGSPNSPATDGILRFDFSTFAASPEVGVGSYFYDIQITDPSGEISTPQIGKFVVKQDITK
ncbi:MAG: hypothetical protein E4G91_01350 [Candidatus Zixiibacteriota bacterium]|nr:MAG: hypothetical protein E4G91_01350 [candidate division Zixibacteria bacterium]